MRVLNATPALVAQQEWFADAVTASTGADAGASDAAAGRALTPGPRMSPAARLQIYRDGYLGRLVECLADDYPALQYCLDAIPDARSFESLCHAYIAAHPSRSPSLNAFGRAMPDFLAGPGGAALGTNAAFAAELARLEWALVEAVHAPPSPALALDRIAGMTPEEWAVARLVPAAATRFLRFAFPVNRYYQAFREDAGPAVPDPEASATLISRPAWAIWRSELTAPMARLLEALVRGLPLGEALASAIGKDDDGADASVTRWFQDWVGGGVFTAVDLGETSSAS